MARTGVELIEKAGVVVTGDPKLNTSMSSETGIEEP